jgi:RNA polymerase sigma-70 factor (ECF subfamily)
MTSNPDILLWESFRKGDREAFARLFREQYANLFRFGSKFTPDTELLEDCIQELFIQLWQSKSTTPVLSIRAYLLKSLKYKLLRAISKKGRVVPLSEEPDFEWSHEMVLIDQQDSAEKKQKVLKALDRLSNRQKEIVYLKYYQNLSYEEVSEIMNINYQVARNLLYQAIRSLRAWMQSPMGLIFLFSSLEGHYIFHTFSTI